jgi:hypothetical protein
MKLRWPKFLTYGNWGGPGWSGGQWRIAGEEVRWDCPAIDEMDRAFKDHDERWQKNLTTKIEADEILVEELSKINVRGFHANVYQFGAILGFFIFILIRRLLRIPSIL